MQLNDIKTKILDDLKLGGEQVIDSRSVVGRKRYQGEDGIIKFVKEILGVERLAKYQEEILRHFVIHKRVAVRGPHGLGKSAMASFCILWLMSTAETDVKIVTTASAWRQLEKFLWPEIHKWIAKASWEKMGMKMRRDREALTLSIRLPQKEAFAAASDNPELLEGAHATIVMYVFDEAKAIGDATWDAAEGAFSQAGVAGHEGYALALSTPGDMLGRFYDIHAKKPGFRDWWTRHVTLAEAIEAGQISEAWAENRRQQWGEDSEVYKRRVLGEFASSGESTVIPLNWVELSNERWLEWSDNHEEHHVSPESIGCDPARFGEDRTVIAKFRNFIVVSIEKMSKMDTMQIANYLHEMDPMKTRSKGVDVIGLGAGVVDRLRELEHPVFGVNTSEISHFSDVSGELAFINLRSALWWMLREYLDPSKPRLALLALPPDDDLTAELIMPRWFETSRGIIKVEAKDEIRKRLSGKSTDSADAVMLALYASIMGSSHGIWV